MAEEKNNHSNLAAKSAQAANTVRGGGQDRKSDSRGRQRAPLPADHMVRWLGWYGETDT